MGLLNKLFGVRESSSSFSSILVGTQNNIFNIYNVTHPTDAQKLKASVYLCISGIAILNDLGGGVLRHAIDRLVQDTRELTKPLSMTVGELSNNPRQLKKILADFQDTQVTEATRVNGLAAFEALYFSTGEEIMNDIFRHNSAPMGCIGYSVIVVAEGIFGKGRAQEHFMEVLKVLTYFMTNLSETVRKNRII